MPDLLAAFCIPQDPAVDRAFAPKELGIGITSAEDLVTAPNGYVWSGGIAGTPRFRECPVQRKEPTGKRW